MTQEHVHILKLNTKTLQVLKSQLHWASSAWEGNRSWVSQEIHKRPPPVPVLDQISPTVPFFYWISMLKIIQKRTPHRMLKTFWRHLEWGSATLLILPQYNWASAHCARSARRGCAIQNSSNRQLSVNKQGTTKIPLDAFLAESTGAWWATE